MADGIIPAKAFAGKLIGEMVVFRKTLPNSRTSAALGLIAFVGILSPGWYVEDMPSKSAWIKSGKGGARSSWKECPMGCLAGIRRRAGHYLQGENWHFWGAGGHTCKYHHASNRFWRIFDKPHSPPADIARCHQSFKCGISKWR